MKILEIINVQSVICEDMTLFYDILMTILYILIVAIMSQLLILISPITKRKKNLSQILAYKD